MPLWKRPWAGTKFKPDLITLYTTNFSEAELKGLIEFYQSPLGKKVMEKMPTLSAQSAQMTQGRPGKGRA